MANVAFNQLEATLSLSAPMDSCEILLLHLGAKYMKTYDGIKMYI